MYNSANALLKGIKANFFNLYQTAANGTFDQFIERVKSNSNEEKYYLPETLPGIKEWTDERHFNDFSDKTLTVINKPYDSGLRVDRDTLDDSREYLGGNVEMWVKSLVDTYKAFPDQLCQALLTANSAAFDGTAFFATSRPNINSGANTLNNLVSGTSSTTYSLSEFEADYISAKTALLGLRDRQNQAFNKNPRLAVLVPTHLEDLAKQLLNDRQDLVYISGTKNNLYRGDAEIFVNWEQTTSGDNDWYLVNLNASFKPFLIQDRKAPNWQVWDDMKSKFIDYGFDFRIGYNFLNPFSAVKVNN